MIAAYHFTWLVVLGNVKPDSMLETWTEHNLPMSENLVDVSAGCFTKIYDKEELIMLTPDAPLYMEEFQRDKVYIIGGKETIILNSTEIYK